RGPRHAMARRDDSARRVRALPGPAAAPPARPRRGARSAPRQSPAAARHDRRGGGGLRRDPGPYLALRHRCLLRRLRGRLLLPAGRKRHDRPVDPILEPLEPPGDTGPARGDEVDEDREIVDPRVPLDEELLLEALQPPKRLIHTAADLGHAPADQNDIASECAAT